MNQDKRTLFSEPVRDMFLLPNVKKDELKPINEALALYCFGTVNIWLDKEVPYCSKADLINFIFSGYFSWTDLDIPEIPKAEYGLGKAAVYFALYHGIDLLKIIESEEVPAVTEFRGDGTKLKIIFNAIIDSCLMGIYSEVNAPKELNNEVRYNRRFYACPFNPSIVFYVEVDELDPIEPNTPPRPVWILNIHNAADDASNQVFVPRSL